MPKVTITVPQEVRDLPVRLRDAMKAADLNQPALAKRAGIGQPTIQRLLEGRETGGQVAHIVLIARALGVRVGWLAANEEPMRDPPKAPIVVDADAVTQHAPHVSVRAKHHKR